MQPLSHSSHVNSAIWCALLACPQVLGMLKDESMRDPERHAEVEKLVGRVGAEAFNRLVMLGKAITDFVEGSGEGKARGSIMKIDAETAETRERERERERDSGF